jgi:arylsulfatase A-like enzyme
VGVGAGLILFLLDRFASPVGPEGGRDDLAAVVFHFSIICFFSGAGAAAAGGWVAVSRAISSRLPPRPGSWLFAFLGIVPVILFMFWVPYGWLAEHWPTLSARHRAISIALLCFVLVAAVLLARTIVAVARRYEGRKESLPPFHWPLAVVSAALAAAFCLADRKLYVGLYDDFHAGLAGLAVLMAWSACVFPEVALSRIIRRRNLDRLAVARTSAALCVLALSAGGTSFFAAGSPPLVRPETNGLLEKLTALARGSTDFDGDGFSSLFGGSDCDGFNSLVSPGKFDFPANGLDEDCYFGDATWPSELEEVAYRAPICEGCNVILITVEALRVDHVGAYGYDRNVTPNLDSIARSSLVFRKAYSNSSKTFYSAPSMMSGRYPSNLTRSYDHPRAAGTQPYVYYLTGETPVFAEALSAAKYSTAAFVHSKVFRWQGMDRGFSKFKVTTKSLNKAIEHVQTAEEPFLLWTHPGQTHDPYVKHKGFDFGDGPADRYDSELAWVDSRIGQLLKTLEGRGLSDRTVIIVTGDHGEEFGDHGGQFHGIHLHNELLHVPLIMKLPGVEHREVDAVVELVDLAPTILELLGSRDVWEFDGESVFAAMARRGGRPKDSAYAEYLNDRKIYNRALTTAEWKLIQNARTERFSLYDVARDPGEKVDVAGRYPEIVRDLYHEMESKPLRNQYALLRSGEREPGRLAAGLGIIQREPLLIRALDILENAGVRPTKRQIEEIRKRPNISAEALTRLDGWIASRP